MMTNKNFSVYQLTLIGVMTAVTCILGPLSIPLPFSPVPISFTNFVLYLSVIILGMRNSTISFLIYLLIGLTGLPVFSGFSGGFGKFAGPTGGYLIGFIFLTIISGFFADHYKRKTIPVIIGMIIGTTVCYLFGTIWLALQMQIPFMSALAVGVIPYLPGDIIKIVLGCIIGIKIRVNIQNAIHDI